MWLPEDLNFKKVFVNGQEILSYMKCAKCKALLLNNADDREDHLRFHDRIRDEAR